MPIFQLLNIKNNDKNDSLYQNKLGFNSDKILQNSILYNNNFYFFVFISREKAYKYIISSFFC